MRTELHWYTDDMGAIVGPPKVFISYSHDADSTHKQWVHGLATFLRSNGVDVWLDQHVLQLGVDLNHEIQTALKESQIVLLVCTPQYGAKSRSGQGGAGFEQTIIAAEVMRDGPKAKRFVPILRRGDPSESLPVYLQTRVFLDMRARENETDAREQLLRHIFGKPKLPAAPVGPVPTFHATIGKAEPVRAWILVAGTGKAQLPDGLARVSSELGQLVANEKYGLISGGWAGVDELVGRAFADAVRSKGLALEDRFIQIIDGQATPAFAAGKLIFVPHGEREWTEAISRADAIVLVGGVGGTYQTGEWGLRMGKPVLPLADTQGDAMQMYVEMQRNWPASVMKALTPHHFTKLAYPIDEVVGQVKLLLGILFPDAVVSRLKRSQASVSDALYNEGKVLGDRWARRFAQADELERLADFVDRCQNEPFENGNSAYGPGEMFYFVIEPADDGQRNPAHDFWEQHLDRNEIAKANNASFVNGFTEGAMEVWNEVRDEL